MSANPAYDANISPPLAEGATTARRRTGPCALCGRPILRGDRYALMPDAVPAHLPCIAQPAGTAARSTA